jgi:hypothetical protein
LPDLTGPFPVPRHSEINVHTAQAGTMGDVVGAASRHLPAHGWRGLLVTAGLVMAVALTAAGCSQPAANGAVVQRGTANVHASGGGHDVEVPEVGTETLTLPIGETVRVSGSGAAPACPLTQYGMLVLHSPG